MHWLKQDKELPQKLFDERSGILNWALEGCKLWQKEKLRPPLAVKEATSDYRGEMDSIAIFISECCVISTEEKVTNKALFEGYKKWAELNNEKLLSKKQFSLKMQEKGVEKNRINSGIQWQGIGLDKFKMGVINDSC